VAELLQPFQSGPILSWHTDRIGLEPLSVKVGQTSKICRSKIAGQDAGVFAAAGASIIAAPTTHGLKS
jgi:hypothetical protein